MMSNEDYERGKRDGTFEAMTIRRRWYTTEINRIREVLQCHALGAEVIALKNPKYERLAALHALEALHKIEKVLIEANLVEEPK